MEDKISLQQLNQQIRQVSAQAADFQARKNQLDALKNRRNALSKKVSAAKQERDDRRSELYRLQTGALNVLLTKLLPGRRQKLDICKTIVKEADAKYDAASAESQTYNQQILQLERQVANGHLARQKLESLLAQKAQIILDIGGEPSEKLTGYDSQITLLSSQRSELEQAVHAGKSALWTTKAIIEKLQNAKSWGTFDLVGGGLISDIAKHGNLDDASQLTCTLQRQIHSFQKELSDISIRADISVQISDFMKFADFAFDGLIADWLVLDRINDSLFQAQKTRDEISSAVRQLEKGLENCTGQLQTVRQQRTDLLMQDT